MSFILDALRKAEAQRQRGTVPGLHTPPLGESPGARDAGAAGPQRWARPQPAMAMVVGAVGLAVLVALAVGWRPGAAPKAPAREPHAELEPQVPGGRNPAASSGPGAGGAAAPPVALPVAPIEARSGAAVVTSERRPRVMAAPDTVGPTAMAHSPGAGPGGGTQGGSAAATMPTPTNPPISPPTAPATAAANEPRVYKPAELPPEIRQQLPTMTVGGAMHSENADSRMLILNGQLYREGEQPAPGITLERIQLRSAVLVFKGWRYEIAY